jgi:hypothetical protein
MARSKIDSLSSKKDSNSVSSVLSPQSRSSTADYNNKLENVLVLQGGDKITKQR